MRLRILTAAASILIASALSAGPVLATDVSPSPEASPSPTPTPMLVSTLDQGQDDALTPYDSRLPGNRPVLVQTFTAGASGPLDRISVNLTLPDAVADVLPADDGVGTGEVLVAVTATSDGVLAEPTLANWDVIPTTGWNDFTLDPAADVTAGTLYTIVVFGKGARGATWNGTCSPTAYTGGKAFAGYGDDRWPEVGTFTDDGCPVDFAFRTYVEVVPAPPVASAPPVARTPPPTSTTPGDGQGSNGGGVIFLLMAGLVAAAACVPLGTRRRALSAVGRD